MVNSGLGSQGLLYGPWSGIFRGRSAVAVSVAWLPGEVAHERCPPDRSSVYLSLPGRFRPAAPPMHKLHQHP